MKRRETLLLLAASTFFVAISTVGLISEMGLSYIPSMLLSTIVFVFLPTRVFIFGVSRVREWRNRRVEQDG